MRTKLCRAQVSLTGSETATGKGPTRRTLLQSRWEMGWRYYSVELENRVSYSVDGVDWPYSIYYTQITNMSPSHSFTREGLLRAAPLLSRRRCDLLPPGPVARAQHSKCVATLLKHAIFLFLKYSYNNKESAYPRYFSDPR